MKIIIPGPPTAQNRPRVVMTRKFPRLYNAEQKQSENVKKILISIPGRDAYMSFDGYLTVILHFFLPIPKSYSKKKYHDAINEIIKPTQCDLDNLIKFILDACNDILWKDDRNIDNLYAYKAFSDIPRTEVEVIKSSTPMQGKTLC